MTELPDLPLLEEIEDIYNCGSLYGKQRNLASAASSVEDDDGRSVGSLSPVGDDDGASVESSGGDRRADAYRYVKVMELRVTRSCHRL